MITESPNCLTEKVKTAEPEEMSRALESFQKARPEEMKVLERRVFELGQTRVVFRLLGLSYVNPSRIEMLRLEYYAMLLRQSELGMPQEETPYPKTL